MKRNWIANNDWQLEAVPGQRDVCREQLTLCVPRIASLHYQNIHSIAPRTRLGAAESANSDITCLLLGLLNCSYMSVGCAALKLILKNFSTMIKTNITAPPGIGVDLSREER